MVDLKNEFSHGCRHLEDGHVFLSGSFVVLRCLLSLFGCLSIVSCQDLGKSAL